MSGLSPVFLDKEHIDLPDNYDVIFKPLVGEAVTYNVASHSYMRTPVKYEVLRDEKGAVIWQDEQKKVPVMVAVEYAIQRSMELILSNRERVVIALELGTFKFSKKYDEIIELSKAKK